MLAQAPNPLSLLADRLDPRPDPLAKDPSAYIRGKGGVLWSIQDEIAQAVTKHRRVAVPSCFDSGKSWLASALTSWWIDTHPIGDSFVATTAPTNPQVRAILWREIQGRHEEWSLPGRVTQDARWTINGRLVAFGRKPSEHSEAAFQGIHDTWVMVLIDEGAGVPPAIFEQAEGLIANENSRIVVFGNPADPASHFAKICKPGSGWYVKHISAFDTPNFTGEDLPQAIKDQLVSRTWVQEAEKRWGKDSFLYTTKVLGQFPKVGKDTLIEPGWILKAQIREMEPDINDAAFGADISRYGDDMTELYLREGGVMRHVFETSKESTMQTTGRIVKEVKAHVSRPVVNVDDDGIGGAVVDRLGEMRYAVVAIKNGASARQPLKFKNRRSEMFWSLREAFAGASGTGDDGIIDIDPADDDLAAQLGEIKYKLDSRGRICVETKDEMRKRGVSSPDRADGVCYAWVREVPMTQAVGAHTEGADSITGDLMTEEW